MRKNTFAVLALLSAVLIVSPVVAFAQFAATPPSGKYCTPLVYRDQVIGPGYKAIVRAAPGCKKPAMLRKQSSSGSVIGSPLVVPVGAVEYVRLFTHRLYYTLDGRTYQRAVVR